MSNISNKRKRRDLMKLMMSDYEVSMHGEGAFTILFHGPPDSLYEGGVWRVHVQFPDNYPYKSPSIGFCNVIYHPNIDVRSGSVCLDVINQTWSPMFDLKNVFDVFLPQLLLYPNSSDPLNGEAAALCLNDYDAYKAKVREYVKKYAMEDKVSLADIQDEDSDVDDLFEYEEEEEEEFSEIDDDPFKLESFRADDYLAVMN